MSELTKKLAEEFSDKEYAHAYLDEFTNMEIAAQIKSLREQRGWTQEALAEMSGMKQTRISKLEDIENDSWTLKTLRKLAKAFDVGIKISFVKVSDRIKDIQTISKESLEVAPRGEDLEQFSRGGYSHATPSADPIEKSAVVIFVSASHTQNQAWERGDQIRPMRSIATA